MCLRCAYAVPGTEVAYGARRRAACSRTHLRQTASLCADSREGRGREGGREGGSDAERGDGWPARERPPPLVPAPPYPPTRLLRPLRYSPTVCAYQEGLARRGRGALLRGALSAYAFPTLSVYDLPTPSPVLTSRMVPAECSSSGVGGSEEEGTAGGEGERRGVRRRCYLPTRCPVLSYRMVLCAYAMSSTMVQCAYAIPGTELAYGALPGAAVAAGRGLVGAAICLGRCCVEPGTELAYGATTRTKEHQVKRRRWPRSSFVFA
eukprot:3883983-Rhodomonas_salina.1